MKRQYKIFIFLVIVSLIVSIIYIDSHNKSKESMNYIEAKAKVLKIDNSNVNRAGISRIGDQSLDIKILNTKFKNEEIKAVNHLTGSLEIDDFYKERDTILVSLMIENDMIVGAKTVSLYRQDWQFILFGIFVLCLLIYAKLIGLKALFSFVASLFVIWEVLIKNLLAGKNPLIITTLALTLLSGIIIFSVAGINKKGISAFVGTMFGLISTIIITVFFGNRMGFYGMTTPFAQTLMFSGYMDLNMQHIFYATIIIGASGAAMDIAMDIAASMEEIKINMPHISKKDLIKSGFNVGRSVIGTMTTTLLLAYSGGYLTLLMLFMVRETSLIQILNIKMVSAEIMRTVVGSIGLVLVAPITAVFAGWIYSDNRMFKIKLNENKSEKKIGVSH
ncbi:YibE/F family protein [Anaeromicrobium sediminis]|uniref:YibE/F family protein n=1 Tax=Anaeromicrobium sediminis TaxID=1478221 RepID=A0A267MJ34_9FIRM|nr:YibE/F family protein [Anaeromicrobium sediminis]PAB59601.1 YibE/F family protein [Anaeromicrobium sediminis]